MLVGDGDNYLELLVSERSTGPHDAGDTRFAIRLRVSGLFAAFTAEVMCWVDLRVLAKFAEQLRGLEERRQGSAVLESMSPGELRLEVRTTDRAGHVAAVGEVGRWLDSGLHDFLFALQEEHDANGQVSVVVDGQPVAAQSDGLHGEPYTDEGWFARAPSGPSVGSYSNEVMSAWRSPVNFHDCLAEAFDRGLRDGPDALSSEDRELYHIQDFIIEYEMGGLSTYFYNRLPDFDGIRTTVTAMRRHRLTELADLLDEATRLFDGYVDLDTTSTWAEVCQQYDPAGRLGELDHGIRALDNYGMSATW